MRLSDTDSCTMHCNKHIIFPLIGFWDNFIEVNALILVPSCYKMSLVQIPYNTSGSMHALLAVHMVYDPD